MDMKDLDKRKITDDEMIQEAFDHLVTSYSRSNHRQKFDIINKAFHFANQAHKGAKRLSGIPYIMHPIAVAQIVCEEMGLGSTSISSALLHDVVEDTEYTVEDIEKLFGLKIAQIVDGLTKISGGILAEAASLQAENMRRLLIAMADDIRVILIKIADRLHNMRTLGSLLPAKQFKIAGETMYLYAPMAHRLGLFAIKTELEDLSFKYEHPDEYKKISQKLEDTAANRGKIYTNFATPLYPKLDELGIAYHIQERVKSVYSIWNKMQAKKVDFDAIYDIFAVRIVFEPKSDIDVKKQCWDIYSIVTDMYKLHPERIRDWVSRPKANGYQALHLTVMADGRWVEVQIRSEQMDEIAEKGFAAHWKYKGNGEHNPIDEQTELDRWLEQIRDVLETPTPSAMDFLDTIKLNLYASEIFVFTPKGEIKILPQGATTLDFAYAIHTTLGDKCIGAKVNHQLVPLSYKISSGDQVEILSSRSQLPQQEWLTYVTTARAKIRIEQSLKKQKKEKTKHGKEMLEEWLKKAQVELSPPALDKLLAFYGYPKKEAFFYAIADKQLELPENPQKIFKDKSDNFLVRYVKKAFNMGDNPTPAKDNGETKKIEETHLDARKIDRKKTFTLDEADYQKEYIAAPCCNPISGDEVLGFIRDDGRLEIHKRSCSEADMIKTRFGDRIISCNWAGHKSISFPGTVEIKGIDRMGMLNDITQVITLDLSVNMRKLEFYADGGVFKGIIGVIIHNLEDINQLSSRLRKIKGIQSVKRMVEG